MSVKTCSQCNLTMSLDDFNYKFKDKGIKQAYCKFCSRRMIKRHYGENKSYYLNKTKKRNKKIRLLIKEYVYVYLMGHPCVDCGENDPNVLEFDHIEPHNKVAPVAELKRYVSLDKIKCEIEKCDVRCANCHRRKTAISLGWNKQYQNFASVA